MLSTHLCNTNGNPSALLLNVTEFECTPSITNPNNALLHIFSIMVMLSLYAMTKARRRCPPPHWVAWSYTEARDCNANSRINMNVVRQQCFKNRTFLRFIVLEVCQINSTSSSGTNISCTQSNAWWCLAALFMSFSLQDRLVLVCESPDKSPVLTPICIQRGAYLPPMQCSFAYCLRIVINCRLPGRTVPPAIY